MSVKEGLYGTLTSRFTRTQRKDKTVRFKITPSNDEAEAENDVIEIMINDWFAKAKKSECNGLDAEILYFEENKYRGVAEQKEFRLLRCKVKMNKW